MSDIKIDPIIHAPARLTIVLALAKRPCTDFMALREHCQLTDGNLFGHLAVLERRQYMIVTKQFVACMPKTSYALSELGYARLVDYLETLTRVVAIGQSVPAQHRDHARGRPARAPR